MLLDKIKQFGIPVVDTISPFDGVDSLVQYTRALSGQEGFIISFADGHKVKIKADEYVRIHKSIERVLFDRNIVDLILNEELDDVLGMLPEVTKKRIADFQARFSTRLNQMILDYDRYYNTVVASGLDRKSYALEWMPTIKDNDPFAPAYVFGRFAGKDGRTMILDYIKKHIGSNVKWDDCARWMAL